MKLGPALYYKYSLLLLSTQVSSQPIHSEEKEDEEGSDTKEDIPSSDSDEDEDDDNTRARFKSERRPVAVKVGGASKRKDIPETLGEHKNLIEDALKGLGNFCVRHKIQTSTDLHK